jgi:DNA-binding response OmpR family regulator
MEQQGSILVIDDDPDFLTGMVALLRAEGYTVFTAPECTAAWDVLGEKKPEVLILDWNLPGTDGLSLLRQMRASEDHKHRYTIMVTARSGRGDLVRGIHEGADDYLTKPFDNEELIARIGVGFRTRRLERELAEQIRKATVLEMAGTVAHEIGNPLAAAKLLQERIASRLSSGDMGELRRELTALGVELQRIEALVRKAQSLTRVHSKPYAADLRIIDIHEEPPPP